MQIPKNEEQREAIIRYYKDGYLQSQIARMVGLSKQRVNIIIQEHKIEVQKEETDMTEFQLSRLDEIVFPRIRYYLLENEKTLTSFCKKVNAGQKTFKKVEKFLTGESENTSVAVIANILKVTGMSFEEAFRRSDVS